LGGAAYLLGQITEELTPVRILNVGQGTVEAAPRIAGDLLHDTEQFLQGAEALILQGLQIRQRALIRIEFILQSLTALLLGSFGRLGVTQQPLLIGPGCPESLLSLTVFLFVFNPPLFPLPQQFLAADSLLCDGA
jgi:hypothetical protein